MRALLAFLVLFTALYWLAAIGFSGRLNLTGLRATLGTFAAQFASDVGETATLPNLDDLRDKCKAVGSKINELREKPAEERSDSWITEIRTATAELLANDALLKVAEDTEERAKGPLAAMADAGGMIRRTPGDQYIEAPEYKERTSPYSGGNLPDIKVNDLMNFRSIRDEIEYRNLLTTGQTDPAAGLFMPRGTPIPPIPRQQRLFIRDVIAVQQTTLNSVPYIRELSAAANEGGATAVAEGAPKPEVTMQFEPADAPIRKLAAWIQATSEVVEDAPTLRGYIDTRLAYMLALREEAQILNGNGISPTIRGIRQTTGLQTQAAVAGDRAATIGLAIGKVENIDGDPDGVAINPIDFWTMLTTRFANQFDGTQVGAAPFGPAPSTIWGLAAVRTRSMESGKFLVGSWRLGATLFDRQETRIKVGDQHSDYFTSNKLVILAEERIGLAVHRPDFFVEGTFA